MRERNSGFAQNLTQRLSSFDNEVYKLPGLKSDKETQSLIEQLVESQRRVDFTRVIKERQISRNRVEPTEDIFDPIRAAILSARDGNLDEACWLVFLSVNFGKHRTAGWRTTAQIYGCLGSGQNWTFARVSANAKAFRRWLDDNLGRIDRRVGNHRKYESLSGSKARGAGAAVESYVDWVKHSPLGNHSSLFSDALVLANDNPEAAFAQLYKSLSAVTSFGRTARFDYLSMLAKLSLANIRPDSCHIIGSTGPIAGAKLLFGGATTSKMSSKKLEQLATEFANYLDLGKDVVEDALCNWQKSPSAFKPFRG